MTTWSDATIVAKREVVSRVRQRSFVISTIVTLLVIVAMIVLPRILSGDPSPWRIGAVGADADAVAQLVAANAPAERKAASVLLADEAAARASVERGSLDVAILPDGTLVAKSGVNGQLGGAIAQAWSTQRLVTMLRAQGTSEERIRELVSVKPATVELLSPPDENRERRKGFSMVATILLFMQLIGFGVWVSMSIIEDKSSRIVEIILAKIRPRSLLFGKVLGLGVLGIALLVLYGSVGLITYRAFGKLEMPAGVWAMLPVVVVAFAVGYLLYASLYAIAGAMAARMEDVQATSGVFNFVLVGAYMAAMSSGGNPTGTAARVFSLVPLTSPLVMPIRIADGRVAVIEVIVSLVLAAVATGLLLLLAERVYRGGALSLRRTMKLSEVFGAARRRGQPAD